MDPFVATARYALEQSVQDLRRSLEGLEAEALNWRPAGADTNSMAVLAVHVLNSTRFWLHTAVGTAPPARDRDSEFVAEAASGDSLRAWFEGMASACAAILKGAEGVDWGATRRVDGEEAPAAFALLHALEHLREHEGQMSLTRQLWEARGQGG
jgi:hypothetical protein